MLRELGARQEVHLLAFIQSQLLADTTGSVAQGLKEADEALRGFCASVRFVPIPAETRRHGRTLLALRGLARPGGYTIEWLRSSVMRREIEAIQKGLSFDLVHFDTISLAPYRSLVRGPATVLDHHNVESHMMVRRAEQERDLLKRGYFVQEGWKLARYERRVCRSFDLNITCSELDSERLLQISPGLPIEVIPNGVDTDYFRPKCETEASPSRLVFAGNLKWYPNRDAMIYFAREVWPRLASRLPELTMDVCGSGPPAELLGLAAKDPRFRVHGFVDDVRPWIGGAAVYVCPIRDGGGTKLKVLDALAMGKALVADPVACEGIAVTQGKDVEFATDPETFVARICDLVGDEERRRRMGAAARTLVTERYSYRSIGARLSRIYESLPVACSVPAVQRG